MKKLILFTITIIGSICLVKSSPVDTTLAKTVAVNFFTQNLPPQSFTLMNVDAHLAYRKVENNTDIFYVYNMSNNNGWVMVAADNAINPILAYAPEGAYSSMDQPPAFIEWINAYKDAILFVKQNNIVADATVSSKWNRLINNTGNLKILLTSVSPLLTTTWNQGCYYNASCPADAGGPCSHVYTGCVATALAQVMKYWNYPVTGTGSHSYTDPTYGTQSANYGATTYNWGGMPNNVTAANAAVATLMYHCGVSVDMEYGISGSAANTSDVPYALINYFGYQNTATYVCRSSYSDNDWINLLKSELDQSRPVQYRGSGPDGGHSFVCDGYDNNSYFHFNWGWGGNSDGYFAIGDLTPGSYDFNTGNCAVIYIRPPCPANQTITGTTPMCPGASATWTSTTTGGTWSSSATGTATINSSTGLVTGISAGSTVITYSVTLYGCTKTATKTLTINPVAAISSVSGTSPLCPGNSAAYTASGIVLGGGTGAWSSSNTTVATVVASTGVVTAVASGGGTANIIYSITGGCGGTRSAQQTLTVTPNAAVVSVSGTSPLCIGVSATYTASGVVLGGGTGTWSSSNTAIATVASTGMATAVTAGTSNIIYTVTGGCGGTRSAQKTLVTSPNAAVASVTGATPLCPGNTAAYATTGVVLSGGTGAWSSSNTSVATVTSMGIVTAIDSGSVNIIYTITGGCGGTASAKKSLIVAPNTEYVLVSGGGTQCGGSRTLTATTSANGTIYWQGTTSGGTSTLTASSSQTVTSSGTYHFRPLSEFGWGTEGSATVAIDSSVAQTIYGPDSLNIGSTVIWTVTTAGGTWLSSVPAVASIDSATGLITGVSAGTAVITYLVNTGVCVNTASKSMIVTDSSANNSTTTAVIIYGGFQACGGCAVCGSDYWCTNTPGSYCGDTPPCTTNTFFDPVPAGNIVTNITINYWTASCNGALIYGTLNGFTVPVATDGSTGCMCSDSICDITTSVTLSYPCGVPGYVYGGNNTFQLCSSDAMCINRAEFIISYYPVSQAPTIPGAVTVTGGGTFCNSALLTASGGTDGTIYWQGTSSLGTSTALPVTSYTVLSSGTYYFRAYSQDGCWGPPGSSTVTINNVPGTITVSGGGYVCSGNTRVLNASGGTNGTIYWQGASSGGTSTASPSTSQTVSSAGTYYFRAKNSCGWGTQGSATITIITALPGAVTVTGGGTFCNSTVITASGGTGGTVYWQGSTSGGTSTATPSMSRTVTASGTYYFRSYNDCGWGAQGSVTMTNSSPGTVTVSGGGTLCNGGSMTLTASGGTGGTIYWQGTSSSGTSTATPATSKTVTANGFYYYRAYNNVCWGSAVGKSVVLTIPGNLTVSGGGTALCSKVLTANGGTGGTIYWQGTTSGGTSTSSPLTTRTVTTSGTYYFRAHNACGWGAESSASVTINPAVNVVLTSDTPVTTSTYPTYYQYQNTSNMTAVVAIAPKTEDHDISINSQYCGLGSTLASSVNISTIVDFAICYYGYQSTFYPIAQYGSSGESIVEYEAGTGINICNTVSGNMQTTEAVNMYEVYLTSGVSYDVLLDIINGSCNLGFALGYTTSFISRNSCALVTDANGASGDESVTGWTCPVSGYYGLVVFNTYTGNPASDYTLKICATPGPVTVSGGGTYCNNTTITATGGYGGTIYWQGTTVNGTSTTTPANTQNVTGSGTYYFRAFNGISWGTQGSATVTINAVPADPSPISTPNPICLGSSATLSASVPGSVISWFAVSCLDTIIGTGDTIIVTPDTNTAYFARAYNGSCWSDCGYVLVDVGFDVPAAVNVTFGSAQCEGNVLLHANGGTGGTIYWQGTASGGTSTATPSVTQTVSASGNYYFRALNSCGWGAQGSATITINPLPSNPSPSASPAVICHGSLSSLSASVSGAVIYWYSGSCAGSQIGIGDTISVTPDATGTYYARAYYNTTGCWSAGCGDVTISVSLVPTADAGTDTTFTGTPVQIGSPLNGPGTIIWAPAVGLSNPTIAQPLASPAMTTTYTLTVVNNNCISTDEVTVHYVNPGHSITGKTLYMGRAYNGSPAPNPPTYNPAIYNIGQVIVLLRNYPSGTELARDTSDASGNYHFTDVPDGNYLLSYDKYTADSMQWGNDINVADVSMLKYLIASDTLQDPSRCFSSKYRKAGNVDNNQYLNVIDVSRIKSKIASPYSVEKNFPKGNWVALDKAVTVSGSDVNMNLETICYGDYNASSSKYRDSATTWNGLKSLTSEIIVVSDECITTAAPDYFEIPLRIITKMNELSALGLELTYPSDAYKLANVIIPKAVHKTGSLKINPTLEEIIRENNDLLVTDEDGTIRVVYATTDHFNVSAGEELINLGFRSLHPMASGALEFKLTGTGLIADQYGIENEDAYLLMPRLFVRGGASEPGFEFTAHPNPFGGEATINYLIPENGNVKIKVYNALGELVSELVNGDQAGGRHTVLFSADNLPSGLYTFKLEYMGTDNTKCLVLKLIH